MNCAEGIFKENINNLFDKRNRGNPKRQACSKRAEKKESGRGRYRLKERGGKEGQMILI